MTQLTNKIKFNRLVEVIKHMPDHGDFVIDFETAQIHNIAGEKIASFSPHLFTPVQPSDAFGTDADSALEEIEESPVRGTDNLNYVREKH